MQIIESEESAPSYSQAVRMKKLSQEGNLSKDNIFKIITEVKPNQQEQYKFAKKQIRSYFPKSFTDKQIEQVIFKLLEQYRQTNKGKEH